MDVIENSHNSVALSEKLGTKSKIQDGVQFYFSNKYSSVVNSLSPEPFPET